MSEFSAAALEPVSDAAKKYTCWGAQVWSGGIAYALIEFMYQGYTHISMFAAGGFCFWMIIRIARSNFNIIANILLCCLCITTVEFIFGCILNLWLKLRIWDYSDQPYHILGQICPRYTLMWLLLCCFAVPLCRLTARR